MAPAQRAVTALTVARASVTRDEFELVRRAIMQTLAWRHEFAIDETLEKVGEDVAQAVAYALAHGELPPR